MHDTIATRYTTSGGAPIPKARASMAVTTAWVRYPNRTTRSRGNRSPSPAANGASSPAGTRHRIDTNPTARVPPSSKA